MHPGTRADIVAAIQAADWIDLVDDPVPHDLGLDPGETAAILLAENLHADAVLIDERRGRAVAAARGISVIGTLGVVAGARRVGALGRAAPIVAELRADGFGLADALVEEFLRGLGGKCLSLAPRRRVESKPTKGVSEGKGSERGEGGRALF